MQRLSPTFTAYVGRQFLLNVGIAFLVMLSLLFMFDMVELLRRASGRDSATLGVVLELAFLKMPYSAQRLIPFAFLFGGMLAFTRLTRSNELVVARAAGVSAWQFLFPAVAIALFLGIFVITVFNPLSSAMVFAYEQLEQRHLKGQSSLLALSDSGIWLRQVDGDVQSVIHASHISPGEVELFDVIVFLYRSGDRFFGRIDAKSARLEPGRWRLDEATLTGPDQPVRREAVHYLPTEMTLARIQESFAPPETLSFWALPRFIAALEAAGFSAVRHRLHFQTILAGPLLLCAMVLIAASFSLRPTRRGGTGLLIVGGLLSGFALFVVSDVVQALGLSASIPVALAAWAPAGASTLLGITLLLHLEDG